MAAAPGMNLQNPDPLQLAIDDYFQVVAQLPRAPAANADPILANANQVAARFANIPVVDELPEDPEWHIEPLCEFNSTISKVAFGALVWIAEVPVIEFLENRIVDLMKTFGMERTADQEIIAIWKGFDAILLKIALLVYIVILGPILEEYVFRNLLQGATRWVQGSDDLMARVIRVLANGVCFGACHLSPAQGYTNIPIFAATFIMGCIFATMREVSGDIVASSTTHILHNGTAMAQFLLRV